MYFFVFVEDVHIYLWLSLRYCSAKQKLTSTFLYTHSVFGSEGQISESANDKEYFSAVARSFDQQKSSADNEGGSN